METKAGYKTTEFWISIFLFLLGVAIFVVDALQASDSIAGKIVAGLISLAGVLGYTVPRAGVKKRALEAEVARSLGLKGAKIPGIPGVAGSGNPT